MKPSLQFTECLKFTFTVPWNSDHHTHGPSHELSLITRGQVETRIGDRVLVGSVGDALLYPSGKAHAPQSVGPLPLEIINLTWIGGEELARIDGPTVRRDREGRLFYLFNWMLDLFPLRQSADCGVLNALAHAALYEFGRLANPAPSDLATRVIRYIRANLRRPLSVDELASESGMSRYHFTRRLKSATGQTPRQLVQQLRIEAARNLILQTDMKLDAISAEIGLADGVQLSHLFRRLTGSPPGKLREVR